MSSTITSNNSATKYPLIEVRDLNLALPLRQYRSNSLRSLFTNSFKSPVETILKPTPSFQVLNRVSFDLFQGERLAVLGVNGSGKTSLCRCLAGMIYPNSGNIKLNGECKAFFDTQAGVIPELTGNENAQLLATFLYPQVSLDKKREIVTEATQFSELNEFLDSPWESYSLGMKARLFLSLATALPTDILILDEVYDNTDLFFQQKMTSRLLNFIKSSRSVIFVSHSEKLIKEICNRAIVLHQSKIVFDGSVEDSIKAYHFINNSSVRQ